MDTLANYTEKISKLNNEVAALWFGEIIEKKVGNRPLFIWGASAGGVRVLNVLKTLQRDVRGFIDIDYKKQGTRIHDVDVYLPKFLCEVVKNDKCPYIIVASMYVQEITNELEKMGFISDQDFFVDLNFFVYFLK